jgi:hypothetical protein
MHLHTSVWRRGCATTQRWVGSEQSKATLCGLRGGRTQELVVRVGEVLRAKHEGGEVRDAMWKVMEKPWKSHGKAMEKPWKSHGKDNKTMYPISATLTTNPLQKSQTLPQRLTTVEEQIPTLPTATLFNPTLFNTHTHVMLSYATSVAVQ